MVEEKFLKNEMFTVENVSLPRTKDLSITKIKDLKRKSI